MLIPVKLNPTALTNGITVANSRVIPELNSIFVNLYSNTSPRSLSRISLTDGSIVFDNTSSYSQNYYQLFTYDGSILYLCHDIGGVSTVNTSTGALTSLTTNFSNGTGGFVYNSTKNTLQRTSYWANQFKSYTLAGVVTNYSTATGYPKNIVIDSSGNAYFGYDGNSVISKFDGSSVSTFTTITGLVGVARITINKTKDYIYVLEKGANGRIFKIKISDGTYSTLTTLTFTGNWIDIDDNDNLYVSDYTNGYVYKIDQTGTATQIVSMTKVFEVIYYNNKLYLTTNDTTSSNDKYVWYVNLFNPAIARRRLLMR